MVLDKSETIPVWDCRNIDVPHSDGLTHERGIEDGLPFYEAQIRDKIRVTVCSKCHPRIPGHIFTIEPDDLEQYFTYPRHDDLFEALPCGYTGTGASESFRKRIFYSSMRCQYNPYSNHAGKTLQVSLAHQWGRESLLPADYERAVERMFKKEREMLEKMADRYSNYYDQ